MLQAQFSIIKYFFFQKVGPLASLHFRRVGTAGNQDASGGLILKGKFVNKAMEKVLKVYYKEYIQCKTCKS